MKQIFWALFLFTNIQLHAQKREENYFDQDPKKFISTLKDYLGQSADNLRTGSDTENEFPIIEGFTEEEYQEYQKRLIEYPLLKDQIEYLKKDILYHRKSIESHNRQMELLLLSATNKKFIDDEN